MKLGVAIAFVLACVLMKKKQAIKTNGKDGDNATTLAIEAIKNQIENYIKQQQENWEYWNGQNPREEEFDTIPDGLVISYVLYIGNLVGKKGSLRFDLAISNTSKDKKYVISNIQAQPSIGGAQLWYYFSNDGSYIIGPGETHSIYVGSAKSVEFTSEGNIESIRNLVCKKCGKKLITNCPKITISDVTTSRISFDYTGIASAGGGVYVKLGDVKGLLRYVKEAYYPKNYNFGYDQSKTGYPTISPGAPTQ